MYDSYDSMPWNQSEDLDFDAARAEWERQGQGNTAAELDRLRSDAEADRIGTAGMRDYIRQLEGLLRDLAAAWGAGFDAASSRVEVGAFYDAVEAIVDEWTRVDPERQG